MTGISPDPKDKMRNLSVEQNRKFSNMNPYEASVQRQGVDTTQLAQTIDFPLTGALGNRRT